MSVLWTLHNLSTLCFVLFLFVLFVFSLWNWWCYRFRLIYRRIKQVYLASEESWPWTYFVHKIKGVAPEYLLDICLAKTGRLNFLVRYMHSCTRWRTVALGTYARKTGKQFWGKSAGFPVHIELISHYPPSLPYLWPPHGFQSRQEGGILWRSCFKWIWDEVLLSAFVLKALRLVSWEVRFIDQKDSRTNKEASPYLTFAYPNCSPVAICHFAPTRPYPPWEAHIYSIWMWCAAHPCFRRWKASFCICIGVVVDKRVITALGQLWSQLGRNRRVIRFWGFLFLFYFFGY